MWLYEDDAVDAYGINVYSTTTTTTTAATTTTTTYLNSQYLPSLYIS